VRGYTTLGYGSSVCVLEENAPLGLDVTLKRLVVSSTPDMAIERTFAMVKPDGVERGLVGTIVARIEAKGYRLVAMKLIIISREVAGKHYGEHAGKPFYEDLVGFITSGPVVAMVLEGGDAITGWRTIMGATNPADAAPGTIRGDYATAIDANIVHGSDSPKTAEREISIFFDFSN
jgi:nucleoside-diphosphate kinase